MCVLKLCSRCEALHYWEKEAHGCQERGESQCNHTINFRWNNVITLMEKILQVFSKILSVIDLWCSLVQRKVSVLRRWAVRVSPRWKSKRRWLRSWERSRLPRPRNKRRSPCEEHKHTHPVETHCLKVGPTKLTVFFLQRGINAFGVQRTGDWQKDGGEEAEEPGGQEEGAGREAGHGLRQQEVMLQHKHVVETPVCVFPVWMCVCVPSRSAVSHSVMSEMQVIEQETPVGAKSSTRSKLDLFDEPGFTSGPPKLVCLLPVLGAC